MASMVAPRRAIRRPSIQSQAAITMTAFAISTVGMRQSSFPLTRRVAFHLPGFSAGGAVQSETGAFPTSSSERRDDRCEGGGDEE